MTENKATATEIGTRIGQAMATSAISEGANLEWTGLEVAYPGSAPQ